MTKKIIIGYLGCRGKEYIQRVIKHHKKGLGIGILIEADGWESGFKALRELCKSGITDFYRVHLKWYDSHIFGTKDIPELKQLWEKLDKIAADYPEITFYCSPMLEHKLSLRTAVQIMEAMPKTKNLVYVNCYIAGGSAIPHAVNEIHHSLNKLIGDYGHSFDGLSCLDADIMKFREVHESAIFEEYWDWVFNRKYSKKDKTLRQDRELIPPAVLIESICELATATKGKTFLPTGWMFKPFAEAYPASPKNHAIPSPRSWKMVIECPVKAEKIELKVKGKAIDVFDFDKFSDERNRYTYRSANYGLILYKEILKLKSDAIANVWINGKKIGQINPIFRENEYKNQDI